MIKKIICPTDFSDEANNATEYAAKLAQILNTKLVLLHVHQIPLASTVAFAEGISADPNDNSAIAEEKLKMICADINKTFKISSDYEIDVTVGSISNMLVKSEDEDTLIVMGSGGMQYVQDFFFGTKTYQVIKKAKCPVLLVPGNCVYKTYKNVAYAMAYEEKARLALKPFYEFIKHFNPLITFLHISEHATEISKDVFRAEKEEIEEFFKGKPAELYFERIYSTNIETAIEKYVHKNQPDLLITAIHHRNIFESVFKRKPILSDLTALPSCPMLALHS